MSEASLKSPLPLENLVLHFCPDNSYLGHFVETCRCLIAKKKKKEKGAETEELNKLQPALTFVDSDRGTAR